MGKHHHQAGDNEPGCRPYFGRRSGIIQLVEHWQRMDISLMRILPGGSG